MAIETENLETCVREERPVEPFERISLDGIGHADVHEGDSDRLVVEAPERLISMLETVVREGTLILRLRQPSFPSSLHGDSVRYDITMRRIHGLAIDGSGSIDAPHVSGGSLDAGIDGAGCIDVGEVEVQNLALEIGGCGRLSVGSTKANEVHCDIDGTGTIEINRLEAHRAQVNIDGQGRVRADGSVDSLTVAVDGAGSVLARGLRARAVDVSIAGVGKATAWAEQSLEATIDGYGRVEYFGNPTRILKRIGGTGRVVRVTDVPATR